MNTTLAAQSRTFRGPAEAGAPATAGLPGVHRAEADPVRVLETERYDTGDLRLAAAGMVLAVHRGVGPAFWQLDLSDDREPVRVPVDRDDAAGGRLPLPAEIAEVVGGAARRRAIRPVARVRTLRTEHRLLGDGDATLATVVHDHVTLATMGRATEVRAWSEVTLEPGNADAQLLAAVVDHVAAAGMRPAAALATAELARSVTPPSPKRATPPKGSAGAVLLAYLVKQTDRLAADDLRVRRGEPDAVHQMRVTARRLRSALQGYRRLLDPERTAPLVTALRELGRSLAPARDAEVVRRRVSAGVAALPDELRLGNAAALTTRYFARPEAEGQAAALAALDGADYADLLEQLDALLADPPLTRAAARRAATELPRHAGRAARRLRRAVDDACAPGERRDEAVHAARKAGKRLRYVTEVARPAVGSRKVKAFRTGLKRLQSALGDHQDTVTTREALRDLGAFAYAESANGFSFGVLYGRDAALAARIEADLPQLWKQAWRTRNRRWLG